jgi:hypothetical protein
MRRGGAPFLRALPDLCRLARTLFSSVHRFAGEVDLREQLRVRLAPGPRTVARDATTATTNEDNMNQSERNKRFVIVGNSNYGLYYGETDATDAEITAKGSVRLENCRHIFHWEGKTGGITSLAASGPCGPRATQSRIGAPAPSALLTSVVNVFDCTSEAVANFAKIEASGG